MPTTNTGLFAIVGANSGENSVSFGSASETISSALKAIAHTLNRQRGRLIIFLVLRVAPIVSPTNACVFGDDAGGGAGAFSAVCPHPDTAAIPDDTHSIIPNTREAASPQHQIDVVPPTR